MERTRLQRLTGAVVLIAAAVILYPVLFTSEQADESLNLTIPEPPPAPEIPEYVEQINRPLAIPEEPADFEPPPEVAAESTSPSGVEKTPPTLDTEGLPISWTLQLAAFSQADNANVLQDKLRKDGYRAYTREGSAADNKSLYRVYVGPDLRKDKLLELRRAIEQSYSLKGMVVRFRP
ncbi:SPOR domain-containing protein [Parendozoicomonas haliclonae]|uniref:Cell division protein DedD n=1 Tax=Parendozoicomonas haliclonae TaxID=1960125 RepID=A0A1X7AK77_9GAMM|nr:SPOR domain-containing protein [Parendozoicomonas haliclonae]SMA47494.1 cell division protein DedD [Parendozoicomonas haliclonae]